MNTFLAKNRQNTVLPVDLDIRARFNPNLNQMWFGSVMAIINNITMLSIVLTGGTDPRAGTRHN